MAKAKEELEIDDEAGVEEDDGEETSVEVAKTNLTKRRIIDNLLEERRLQRQLSDYRLRRGQTSAKPPRSDRHARTANLRHGTAGASCPASPQRQWTGGSSNRRLATWPSGLPSPFAPLRFPGQSARGLAASDFLVYCLDKSLAPEIRQ